MKVHQIKSKSKCVKCVDNQAALSLINRNKHKKSRRRRYSDDIDIVTMIVKEWTLQYQLRWVKAHQDDKKLYKDLDIWGQVNCDTNGLAEKFRKLMDDGDVKPLKEGVLY
jgi:hypothetical protein